MGKTFSPHLLKWVSYLYHYKFNNVVLIHAYRIEDKVLNAKLYKILILKETQKSCIPHTIQNLYDTPLPGTILCQNPITSDSHSFKIDIPRNATESLKYIMSEWQPSIWIIHNCNQVTLGLRCWQKLQNIRSYLKYFI